MPARSTRGDHAPAHPSASNTCRTPAAAAVRRIVPRFPGSWTPSSTTRLSTIVPSGLTAGRSMIASTPEGVSTGLTWANKVSGNTWQGTLSDLAKQVGDLGLADT